MLMQTKLKQKTETISTYVNVLFNYIPSVNDHVLGSASGVHLCL